MIEPDAAAPHLKLLADPVLEAFAEANAAYTRYKSEFADFREPAKKPVRATGDGVNFWMFFSTAVSKRFAVLDCVRSDASTDSAVHSWIVNEVLRIRMKSEISELALDQLVIAGLNALEPGSPAPIVLTWRRYGSERWEPMFVHVGASGPLWSRAVEIFREAPDSIRPAAPRPRLSSRRQAEASADGNRKAV